MLSFLAFALPSEADAQCRRYSRKRSYASRNYSRRYVSRSYQTQGYTYRKPSFYRRHRNMINMGIATGGGALLGGLIGGRRGVGLGALIGLGSGALYTYKLNKKKRRY